MAIPDEVQNLIHRKLRFMRREEEREIQLSIQNNYSAMQEEVQSSIVSGAVGRAVITAPLEWFQDIAASAVCLSIQWPEKVWKTIVDLAESSGVLLHNSKEVNAIVDEYAWNIGAEPFTLGYVSPVALEELVIREVSRYGVNADDLFAALQKQLNHEFRLIQCKVLNSARTAREKVGIEIEAYLLSQASRNGNTPELAIIESPEERKERLQHWLEQEVRMRGKSGAINRTAEREGISRQRLSQILDR
ncbi:hypothetical protein FEF65_02745 [Mariprofundus erugo]|uniref:Uncharacterized protein n=1 Tax=Mariprofundus erugo TaxID=2528639 RepID=A0A5R9GQU9_9PROT|nr:hypothetical protein [Mariprofundus erugo]TLS68641.1 hypothetical protein FEF65_02745 [Mariprofundus erugo]